jgi:hypothetical protein
MLLGEIPGDPDEWGGDQKVFEYGDRTFVADWEGRQLQIVEILPSGGGRRIADLWPQRGEWMCDPADATRSFTDGDWRRAVRTAIGRTSPL